MEKTTLFGEKITQWNDEVAVFTDSAGKKYYMIKADLKNEMKDETTPFTAYLGGNSDTASYVKLGNLNTEILEGIGQNFTLSVDGGNNYAKPRSFIRLSGVCHRGSLFFDATFIGRKDTDISLGYRLNGSNAEVWMKTDTYRHHVIMSILYKIRFAFESQSSSTKPDGWIDIPIS